MAYNRALSSECISFSSVYGRQLFKESLVNHGLEVYFTLAPHFRTQIHKTGSIATLAMILNSLDIDPQQVWKGVWRDYHEDVILNDISQSQCIKYNAESITFDDFLCLVKYYQLRVIDATVTSNLATFRRYVAKVCSNEINNARMIVLHRIDINSNSYRFSPIGGYHQANDYALILDVFRIQHPPYWLPLSLLYETMHGYIIVTTTSSNNNNTN